MTEHIKRRPTEELHIPDGVSSHLVPEIGEIEMRHGTLHWGKEAVTRTPEEQIDLLNGFLQKITQQGGDVTSIVPIIGYRTLGSGQRVPENRLAVIVKNNRNDK